MSSSPGSPGPPGRSRLRRILPVAARAAIALALLGGLVARLGAQPFERSLAVLRPGPLAAAVLLGVVATAAQAMRWRTVDAGYGAAAGLTRARAVAECYRSTLLNSVLPGGMVGDAVRAWRQRPGHQRGLHASARAVLGERLAGTALLLLLVAAVTLPLEPWLALLLLAGAVVAALIAAPALSRLPRRGQAAVWGWSLLALAALVAKFAVAALALGTAAGPRQVVTLALITLAGMSLPLGIGGFGPREAVAAMAFSAVGLSAGSGVATAAGYGLLAGVSTLPGAVIMLAGQRPDRARRTRPAPA